MRGVWWGLTGGHHEKARFQLARRGVFHVGTLERPEKKNILKLVSSSSERPGNEMDPDQQRINL